MGYFIISCIKTHFIKLFFTAGACCVTLQGSETLSIPCALMMGIGFQETSAQLSSLQHNAHYEQIKFLLFQAEMSSIVRNVEWNAGIDYGIFGKGEAELLSTFFCTDGTSLDAMSSLGYCINLTPDRLTSTYLIPEVGYKGSWLNLKMISSKLKELWYGPYLGGSLQILNNQGFAIGLSYHYHWLNLHALLNSPLSSQFHYISHHAYGHEASLKIQSYLFQNITMGAALHYFYYYASSPRSYSTHREDLSISVQYTYIF